MRRPPRDPRRGSSRAGLWHDIAVWIGALTRRDARGRRRGRWNGLAHAVTMTFGSTRPRSGPFHLGARSTTRCSRRGCCPPRSARVRWAIGAANALVVALPAAADLGRCRACRAARCRLLCGVLDRFRRGRDRVDGPAVRRALSRRRGAGAPRGAARLAPANAASRERATSLDRLDELGEHLDLAQRVAVRASASFQLLLEDATPDRHRGAAVRADRAASVDDAHQLRDVERGLCEIGRRRDQRTGSRTDRRAPRRRGTTRTASRRDWRLVAGRCDRADRPPLKSTAANAIARRAARGRRGVGARTSGYLLSGAHSVCSSRRRGAFSCTTRARDNRLTQGRARTVRTGAGTRPRSRARPCCRSTGAPAPDVRASPWRPGRADARARARRSSGTGAPGAISACRRRRSVARRRARVPSVVARAPEPPPDGVARRACLVRRCAWRRTRRAARVGGNAQRNLRCACGAGGEVGRHQHGARDLAAAAMARWTDSTGSGASRTSCAAVLPTTSRRQQRPPASHDDHVRTDARPPRPRPAAVDPTTSSRRSTGPLADLRHQRLELRARASSRTDR